MSLVLWLCTSVVAVFELHKTLWSSHHFTGEKNEILKNERSKGREEGRRNDGKREEGEGGKREGKKQEKEDGRWTNKPNYMHTTIIGVAFKPALIGFWFILLNTVPLVDTYCRCWSDLPFLFEKEIISIEEFLKVAENDGVVLYSGRC